MDCSTADKGGETTVTCQVMGTDSTGSTLTDPPKGSDPVLECDGFIQIEHAVKGKSGRRITEVLPVLDVLGKLPSFIDPTFDTVPCQPDFYDKWARDSRSDSTARPPIRPISVTAKCWSVMQSMQNTSKQCPESTTTPTLPVQPPKSSPGRIIPRGISCNSLDSIIEHYNQLFPSPPPSNIRPSLKLGTTTISYTHPPRRVDNTQTVKEEIPQDEGECDQDEDNVSETQNETTDVDVNRQNDGLARAQRCETLPSYVECSTQINCIVDISPSTMNKSQPILPMKKFGLQQIPLQASHTAINWPSSINKSDSLCQLARFWTWRPKKPAGKAVTSIGSTVLVDDLDTSAKHLKREKSIIRKLAQQNRLISSGILYDVFGKKDKDRPCDKFGMGGRSRTKNSSGSGTKSRNRKGLSGRHVRSTSDFTSKSTTDASSRLSTSADVQQTRLENDTIRPSRSRFLSQDKSIIHSCETCNDSKRQCGNMQIDDTVGLHSNENTHTNQSELCTMFHSKTHLLNVSNSNNSDTLLSMEKDEDVSIHKTPEPRPKLQNDTELPRVQFMDLNDLKTVFGHLTKGKASSARNKRNRVDFRPIGLPVRLKSRESVTQRCD